MIKPVLIFISGVPNITHFVFKLTPIEREKQTEIEEKVLIAVPVKFCLYPAFIPDKMSTVDPFINRSLLTGLVLVMLVLFYQGRSSFILSTQLLKFRSLMPNPDMCFCVVFARESLYPSLSNFVSFVLLLFLFVQLSILRNLVGILLIITTV